MKSLYADIYWYDRKLFWLNAVVIGIPLILGIVVYAGFAAYAASIDDSSGQALGYIAIGLMIPVIAVGTPVLAIMFFVDTIGLLVLSAVHALHLLRGYTGSDLSGNTRTHILLLCVYILIILSLGYFLL